MAGFVQSQQIRINKQSFMTKQEVLSAKKQVDGIFGR